MPEVIEKPRARKSGSTIAKVTTRLAPTLGNTIDQMWALREEKRSLDAQVKVVEADIKTLEAEMFGMLDAQDTRKAEGKKASVSIGESIVATVEDWDALWPWIAKTKNFHLIQKRVSDPGMRELWALGKVIPGTQPFTKRTLSLKSL